MRRFVLILVCLSFGRLLPAQQPQGLQSEYLWEFKMTSKHLVDLAEAMPPEKFGWRPSDGVRSVSEVFVHIAAGNFLLLDLAGAKAPDDLYGSVEKSGNRPMVLVKKNAELEKTMTGKQQVVDMLKRSLQAVQDNFSTANEASLNQPADFFGRKTTDRAIYLRILAHINEHLGQSIAYARVNGVVPPWSQHQGSKE